MASPTTLTVNDLLTVLAFKIRDDIIKTANRTSRLLRILEVKPPESGGRDKLCSWDLEGTGQNVETFAEGADASNFGSDKPFNAALAWARYRSNFKITNDAILAAARSPSPAGYLRPWAVNLLNSLRVTASKVNQDLYGGAGGDAITGLNTALLDDNTYATIDRTDADYAGFRANVMDDGANTDPTIALLRKDITVTVPKQCGESPDIGVCSLELFNKITNKFQDIRRLTQPINEIMTARGKVLLDFSLPSFSIEGCTFIGDKDATAGTIYYLNTAYAWVEYLPQNEADLAAVRDFLGEMKLNDGYGEIPLGASVFELARNGSSRRASMEVRPQLVVYKPNACGRRTNVSET